MKKRLLITNTLISLITFLMLIMLATPSVLAQNRISQIGYDAPDGDRITGFIYHAAKTPQNAPVAILMHGLMGSSLSWLASGNFAHADKVSAMLIEQGYRVIALDARSHGGRKDHLSPMARVKAARAGNPEAYSEMINKTVADYRFLLGVITTKYPDAPKVIAIGYSMGGQMASLLAASEGSVTHLVTMVPPAVRNVLAVAPITYASDISVPWLLLTAEKDQFSTPEQNAELIEKAGKGMKNISFKSGHLLPVDYVSEIGTWLKAQ